MIYWTYLPFAIEQGLNRNLFHVFTWIGLFGNTMLRLKNAFELRSTQLLIAWNVSFEFRNQRVRLVVEAAHIKHTLSCGYWMSFTDFAQ